MCTPTVIIATGCTAPTKQIDYTAFKQSRRKTILSLPPLNESLYIKATYSMLSQISYLLGEAGYYVLPVAVSDETLKQNGMSSASAIFMRLHQQK